MNLLITIALLLAPVACAPSQPVTPQLPVQAPADSVSVGTTVAPEATPGDFSVTVVDSGMQVREHRGKQHVSQVMLTVELQNPGDAPLVLTPSGLEVHSESIEGAPPAKLLATCPYARGVVWKANATRNKSSSFRFPLAPRETVLVKLFYDWPSSVSVPPNRLVNVASFASGERAVTVRGVPYNKSVIGEGL